MKDKLAYLPALIAEKVRQKFVCVEVGSAPIAVATSYRVARKKRQEYTWRKSNTGD